MDALTGPEARARLLDAIPDAAERVDLHGLLHRPRAQAWADPGGGWGCVRDVELRVVGVYGATPAGVLRDAVRPPGAAGTALDLFALPSEAMAVRAAFPGAVERAGSLFTLPRATTPPITRPTATLASGARAALSHVPSGLREELERALDEGLVIAALHAGQPVSFCYAHHVTARWWDVSVDTLEPWRRRGLAAAAAAAMIAAQRALGREPVWGALDENPASGGLARKLGFRPFTRFAVIAPASA